MNEQQPDKTVVPVQAQPIQLAQPFAAILQGGSLQDIQKAIEREVAVTDMVRKMCLRLTSLTDWIDQNGKPYLQWTGSSKVASKIGLRMHLDKDSQGNPSYKEDIIKDDEGECFEVIITGTVEKDGLEIPEMGTATSRDSLWGVRKDGQGKKYFVSVSEVDRTDVRKKAVTNFLNRALKSRMGFSFTWEEIAKATNGAITKEKVAGIGGKVTYQQGTKGGNTDTQEVKDHRAAIWKMCLELADGEEEEAKKILIKQSTFSGKDGKTIFGKDNVAAFSDKWIVGLYPKIREFYDNELIGRYGKEEPGK